MAYTYDDFLSAAKNAGMMEKFSDDDLAIAQNNPEYGLSALKLQQDLHGATTTEQKLLAQVRRLHLLRPVDRMHIRRCWRK